MGGRKIPDDRAQALVDVVNGERRIFESVAGVPVGELLGCGRNGCVFSSVPGSVVKVSFDDGESMLARSLVGPRRETFLPIFHGGWTIAGPRVGADRVFRFGVILREDLADFEPVNLAAYADAIMVLLEDGDGTSSAAALVEYSAVCRQTRRAQSAVDIEAINAISGLLAWGDRNGVDFDRSEFSWEEDPDATDADDEILPNAITNLGVTSEGRVVVRDLGGFEPTGIGRCPGDRKPLEDMARRLRAGARRRNSGADEWLYSVTYFNRLESIAENGLVRHASEAIGVGCNRSHSSGRVFLTHCDGVFFWYSRYQDHAEHRSDDVLEDGLIPVVLRLPRVAVTHELHEDPHGVRDARHPAWFVEGEILPDEIEVWDGEEWIDIADWEAVDPRLAVNSEEDPDEPGHELHWWDNSEPLRPRCESEAPPG